MDSTHPCPLPPTNTVSSTTNGTSYHQTLKTTPFAFDIHSQNHHQQEASPSSTSTNSIHFSHQLHSNPLISTSVSENKSLSSSFESDPDLKPKNNTTSSHYPHPPQAQPSRSSSFSDPSSTTLTPASNSLPAPSLPDFNYHHPSPTSLQPTPSATSASHSPPATHSHSISAPIELDPVRLHLTQSDPTSHSSSSTFPSLTTGAVANPTSR